MSNPKIDALSRVPLFANSAPKELEFLTTRTDEVQVEAGRTLIRQGSPSDSFYLLLDGEAEVTWMAGPDRRWGQGGFSAKSACWIAALPPQLL